MRLKELTHFMDLKPETTKRIMQNLETDVKFLQDCRFMDYSLLLAIRKHDCDDHEVHEHNNLEELFPGFKEGEPKLTNALNDSIEEEEPCCEELKGFDELHDKFRES